jgi:TonB family protein
LHGELISYYNDGKIKRRENHKWNDTMVTGVCFGENGEQIPFTKMIVLPKPEYSIVDFFGVYLRYPGRAEDKKQSGIVSVSFIVTEEGDLDNIKIENPFYPILAKEVLRVVKKMPAWKPGMIDGKVSRIQSKLPVEFKINVVCGLFVGYW